MLGRRGALRFLAAPPYVWLALFFVLPLVLIVAISLRPELGPVELCTQHPGKMWVVQGQRMVPLLPFALTMPDGATQPWHSTPYQALPPVYVQNASLEIAWSRVVFERRTIAGDVIVPFVTEGYEGFDINDPVDWMVAERLLADGAVTLPLVACRPYDWVAG